MQRKIHCIYDGNQMTQSPGYFTYCGPEVYGTSTEYTCPVCPHIEYRNNLIKGELKCECDKCKE